MNEIQKLLNANHRTSENQLTVDNVKRWLAKYIELRSEDVARFPNESDTNHWDLIAADYDSSKDARFIAAYFSGDRVTFLAGHGPISDVRAFAQSGFPDNPDHVLDELTRKFDTGDRWTADVREVIAWVQQG